MSKATTNYARPSKTPTDTAYRSGVLIEYGDNPPLDGSVPYGGFGQYPIHTNSARTTKQAIISVPTAPPTTGYTGNPAFETATKLDSSTVRLDSSTVPLTGYTPGTHFRDTKSVTSYGTP